MAKIGNVEIPSLLFDEEASDPTTPASGFWRLYTKATGLFHRDDAGAVTGPLIDETAHDLLDHTGLTGVGGGSATFVGAKVYNSAVQSIAENSVDVIALFNTELFDTDAIHDTGSNTGRMTIPAGMSGKWRFAYHIAWATTSATGIRFARLLVNAGLTVVEGTQDTKSGSTAFNVINHLSTEIDLVAGDYVQVGLFQNRGSGNALDSGFAHATNRGVVNTFECSFLG